MSAKKKSDSAVTPIPSAVTEQLKLVKSEGALQPLTVVRMDTVEPEEIEWLWKPFIARRKLTAMTGEEGIGKSWITCALASIVSNGGWFPNCPEKRTNRENVLILASEDGVRDTLKPRLTSVGADQQRVFTVTDHFSLSDVGIMRFHNLVSEYRPALVIIDPFFSYLTGGLNINLSTEIRPITSKLAGIAEEYNSAFLLVRHVGKTKGLGDARSAGLGSIDFRAVCRSELLVGKDPDHERRGAIVQIKNNLEEFGKAVGYEIREGKLLFMETELTAGAILSSVKSEDDRNAQAEAIAFLREALRDGAVSAIEVKKEASQVGISEQQLRTARAKLGIEVYKRGNVFGKNQKWYWRIKEASSGEDV